MGFRSGGGGAPPFQPIVRFTPVVKRLLIVNVAVWFVGQVILDQLILKNDFLISWFGLQPAKVVMFFYLWQPLTYMFLHTLNPTHILFNMLMLVWLGTELEERWKSRFFGTYFFVCGIGAALIYTLGATIYWAVTGNLQSMLSPVVGASGAVFGLLLAYGIIFGERIVSFMFLFQMKAKYFVLILGMIEVVLMINNGVGGGGVANLAHLGGVISGYLFLVGWTKYQSRKRNKGSSGGRGGSGGRLKIVVNNDQGGGRPGGSNMWH